MPPEMTKLTFQSYVNSNFFYLLRPELVQEFPMPLIPDAGSKFIKRASRETQEHARKSTEAATLFLLKRIDQFAQSLKLKWSDGTTNKQTTEQLDALHDKLRGLEKVTNKKFTRFNFFLEKKRCKKFTGKE